MSRTRIPEWLRRQVADEAQHRCGYCLMAEHVVGMPMELDHLIPEALGGATQADNLWLGTRRKLNQNLRFQPLVV